LLKTSDSANVGLTAIPLAVPVMLPVTVSVAVNDWLPAVWKVTVKLRTPWSMLVKE
jgi:hypothetical protein